MGVNDLIEATKERLSRADHDRQLDILSLSTLYWVDAQTFKYEPIFVVLSGKDKLQKILSAYKYSLNNSVKIVNFYWFLGPSPASTLGIPTLDPTDIQTAPDETRQKYHRKTPLLYSGFYFDCFMSKSHYIANCKSAMKG